MKKYMLLDFGQAITKIMRSAPNALIRLIECALGEKLVYDDDIEKVDIIVMGPYGDEKTYEKVKKAKAWKLFYTGENITPNFALYDNAISFSPNTYQGRNFRFPVWMFELNWFEDTVTTFTRTETEYLLKKNRPLKFSLDSFKNRRNQVIAIFNAFEHNRFEVARTFIQRSRLVGMGRPFGNENNWSGGFYREKCEVISSFMCNMCFENTISMGYVTEKPLHARAMGALPLLYCDTTLPDFNWEATVNLNDFSSVREFVELTEFYLSKPDLLFEKLDTPIFNQLPSLDYVTNFINSSYQNRYLP